MPKVAVEIEKLKKTSESIIEKVNEYEMLYKSLFKEASALAESWEGTAFQKFIEAMKEYEVFYKSYGLNTKEYAEVLKSASKTYYDTEVNIKERAKRLK